MQPSSDSYLRILAGDEVVQVNDQIVVSDAVFTSLNSVDSRLTAKSFCPWSNNLHTEKFCVTASGGLEQKKPHQEAAGESQRSDPGLEEDSWISATQRLRPALLHTGQI